MSVNTKIAFVHLTARLKQTVVAILSVVFGVSMYVFMNSFMTGVNNIQTELAFSTLAHVRVYNDEPEPARDLLASLGDEVLPVVHHEKNLQFTSGVRNASEITDTLQSFSEIEAIAPELSFAASLQSGAITIDGSISGVEPGHHDAVFDSAEYMFEGSWHGLGHRPDGVILGKTLAENLGVGIDEDVQISTLDGTQRRFHVVGIIQLAVASVDGRKGYINLGAARQLKKRNADFVSDLQLRISDYEKADHLADRLSLVVPYTVEPWQTASGQLEAGSQLRNIIALAVSLAILIVAGFGIYNIMNMTVSEKLKEIAILNAMGFDGGDIVRIFMFQSIIIGIFGGLFGTLLGFFISSVVDNLAFPIATLETYPIAYEFTDYLMALTSGLFTTLLAGYLPARKASRVDPVAILRG